MFISILLVTIFHTLFNKSIIKALIKILNNINLDYACQSCIPTAFIDLASWLGNIYRIHSNLNILLY